MGKSFKLRNGLLLLSTEAPGGVYNAAQLKKIAALCDGDAALVKATEDQRLAVFVAPEKAAKVAAELKVVGLGVRHYQDGLHQPVNCLGELCGEHLQDALGASMDLARELALVTLTAPLKIGINGCARCCVATHSLDISIIGDAGGYRISLGGKNSQIPEMASFMAEGVPAAKLPKLVAKVISVYKELAAKDESLQEVMERCGSTKFIDALAPYSQDAHQAEPFAGIEAGGADAGVAKLDGLADAGGFGSEPDVGLTDLGEGAGDAAASALADVEDAAPAAGTGGDAGEPALEADLFEPMDAGDVGDADELPADLGAGSLDWSGVDGELDAGRESGGSGAEAAPLGGADSELDDVTMLDGSARTDNDAVLDEEPMHSDAAMLDDFGLLDDGALPDGVDSPGDAARGAPGAGEAALADSDVEIALGDESLELMELDAEIEPLAPLVDDPALAEEHLMGAAATVTATPPLKLAAPPPPDDDFGAGIDGELAADEAGEEEADLLEQKLNDSIAEEEGFPEVEDVNSASRLEAMKLVEAGAGGAEPHDFDDLEINVETPQPAAPPAKAAPARPSAPLPTQAAGRSPPAAVELSGIDITAEGRVALQFASGATIMLDDRALSGNGRRELRLLGKVVVITPSHDGVHVEVDGLGIFLPRQAA